MVLMVTNQEAVSLLVTVDTRSAGSAVSPHIVASRATIANW